jgi:hypothetical protein
VKNPFDKNLPLMRGSKGLFLLKRKERGKENSSFSKGDRKMR